MIRRLLLVADGPADRCLLPVLEWLLSDNAARRGFADGWMWDFVPRTSLARTEASAGGDLLSEQLASAITGRPVDVLFVHRDAESRDPEPRHLEIAKASKVAGRTVVPIVPVRMTEAWLLVDESSIRKAADNPNGSVPILLPNRPEDSPDPKQVLADLILQASELTGRRLAKLRRDADRRQTRVAEYIAAGPGFGALDRQPAFERLRRDVERAFGRPVGTAKP